MQREAEEERQGEVMAKAAEVGVIKLLASWCWKGPGAKKCWQLLGSEKGRERKGTQPTNTLMLAQRKPFQIFDLCNCRIIHICCVKSVILWYFVIATIGN